MVSVGRVAGGICIFDQVGRKTSLALYVCLVLISLAPIREATPGLMNASANKDNLDNAHEPKPVIPDLEGTPDLPANRVCLQLSLSLHPLG